MKNLIDVGRKGNMQYRTMPKNGDRLSALGFGCMRLPLKGQKIDEPRAIRLIHDAIEQGVNYFDTAWPYHGARARFCSERRCEAVIGTG